MLFKLSLVVPARFFASILQIILTSILLMYRKWNLNSCGDSLLSTADLTKVKDDEYTIGLSFILALTGLQLISLIFGLTLYSNLTNFLTCGFNVSGVIALLFFMFYRSCVDSIWPIMATCSFLPFLVEIISVVRICAFKKLPAY